MNKKLLHTILFICLVILAGYLRETFFVRIKWCEAVISSEAIAPKSFWLFSFLDALNFSQLQIAKYCGTIFFVIVFWLIALLMIKTFFELPFNYKIIHAVFALVFGASLLIYSIGLVIPFKGEFYNLSRWIMGLIETPIIIAVLYPAFWIKEKADQ